ncbi:MAG TPA: hypothetical protein VFV35_04760, partial [Acidimicrobiales bacterium]|nr:hypothetical protein [Acidimicrobiales bacterium]
MLAELLVLAVGSGGGAVVDLETGALIRIHWAQPPGDGLVAYDVVAARLTRDDEHLPFPHDSFVASRPEKRSALRGRRVERLLRPLVHPDARPLLGAPTPRVAYWTLRDDQPSVALVSPTAGPVVERDAKLRLRCRFR